MLLFHSCVEYCGAVLAIGICFGIPDVREKLIISNLEETSAASTLPTSSETLTSISNYSDTSTYVASKVLPSVVGITAEYTGTSIFGRPSTSEGSGSGIIISEDGYILTNNHIVSGNSGSYFGTVSDASKITVYLYNDTTPYEAKIIGKDDVTDLAVIKIEQTGLTAADIGNSDSVKPGEFAMAIGNPLGMQSSVTVGIISAVNREVTDSNKKYTLIQTDAAINAGNSGGALVNASGEVIGINTLKFAGSGIEGMGFAIPISSTTDIISQLIQYNKVKRPYIGISGISIDEQMSKQYNYPVGVYVKDVETFSPAEKAGLRTEDVILKIDGKDVETVQEINEIKNAKKIGDEIEVLFSRNGDEKTVKLKLEEQP